MCLDSLKINRLWCYSETNLFLNHLTLFMHMYITKEITGKFNFNLNFKNKCMI